MYIFLRASKREREGREGEAEGKEEGLVRWRERCDIRNLEFTSVDNTDSS